MPINNGQVLKNKDCDALAYAMSHRLLHIQYIIRDSPVENIKGKQRVRTHTRHDNMIWKYCWSFKQKAVAILLRLIWIPCVRPEYNILHSFISLSYSPELQTGKKTGACQTDRRMCLFLGEPTGNVMLPLCHYNPAPPPPFPPKPNSPTLNKHPGKGI